MDTFFKYFPLLNAFFCAGLGLHILSRKRKEPVNIAFFLGMASLGTMELAATMGWPVTHGSYPFLYDKIFGAAEILHPAFWLLFSLLFARPGASDLSRRSRLVLGSVFVLSGMLLLPMAAGSDILERLTSKGIGLWISAFTVVVLTFTLVSFEFTLRSAAPAQRQKIKLFLLGLGSILAFRIYAHSQYLLFPFTEQDHSAAWSSILFLSCLIILFSLVRHRLMDTNLFISRHLFYTSFSLAAVGGYLLLVGAVAQAIRSFSGIPAPYLRYLFVFLTVLFLLAILLSHRIQKRVKTFIERNFYQSRYDYRKEWIDVTERLSSRLNVEELLPAVSDTFLQTLWIESSCLWMYDDQKKTFERVRDPRGDEAAPVRWGESFVKVLRERDYPIRLSRMYALPEGGDLGEEEREKLRAEGIRILSPLVAGGRFVGVLGLSDTMSKYPLDREDHDLIRTISKQAAGALLSARLSRNLVTAKEMETFHAFSAFVLHDMKNFVSMLSLVVHNARDNMDDPEFRADAMQSISQTVAKMKRMMDRLAVLSMVPTLNKVAASINDVAREALAGLDGARRDAVVTDYGKVPMSALDPDQMGKVVTNLVLNAREALAGEGEIRLSTRVADGKVVLTVSDTGCGMTEEFIRERLFKPFSTTKSGGFGIGLYQVKGIVEAHGGEIQVESVPGRGTSFRVILPGHDGVTHG